MASGMSDMRIGSGRRSCFPGGAGSRKWVSRYGGSSRGGRLKSKPAPSSDGCSAASGGSYGPTSSRVAPMASCIPGRQPAGPVSGTRSSVAGTPSNGATCTDPRLSTETRAAWSGSSGSLSRMCASGLLPISTCPTFSRCTVPAAGPPAARTSTSPAGSGGTQPAGSPRLTTQPSRSGDSARVSRGLTGRPSTNTAAWPPTVAAPPGAACTRELGSCSTRAPPPVPPAPAASSGATAPSPSLASSSATTPTSVCASASRTRFALVRDAGETTVSASRISSSGGRFVLNQAQDGEGAPRGGGAPLRRGQLARSALAECLRELVVELRGALDRGAEELAQALDALHDLRAALVDLRVGLDESRAGLVGLQRTAGELVCQLQQVAERRLQLLGVLLEDGLHLLHLGIAQLDVCDCWFLSVSSLIPWSRLHQPLTPAVAPRGRRDMATKNGTNRGVPQPIWHIWQTVRVQSADWLARPAARRAGCLRSANPGRR